MTNVFLNLYPKRFLGKLLAEDENRAFELLRSLQGIRRTQVIEEGRSYGGGLHKLEPREMGSIAISKIPEWLAVNLEEQLTLI